MEHVNLVPYLHKALADLSKNPYPVLQTTSTAKRASVALIIRISPAVTHWPDETEDIPATLSQFLQSEWTRYGEPEVLFIKRAARKGDRWTSHVALPGGRRDPEDLDDEAAAARETIEEVGLDLRKYALRCGNLPQRLVTTSWGKRPLLVLCPYVYILTTHDIPPLKLQPTEVAATHWVPLRSLLSPTKRTVVYEDVSSRIANQETGVRKWMVSMILGQMMFAAINLAPSESLHSWETPAPDGSRLTEDNRYTRSSYLHSVRNAVSRLWRADIFGQHAAEPPEEPLLLWGLTLGAISDFLDLLPPHNALTLWSYPTFTPLDVRLTIAVMTYRYKNRKRVELQAGTMLTGELKESDDSMRRAFGGVSESTVLVERPDETGLHGLGSVSNVATNNRSKKAAVSTMLDGYVDVLAKLFLPEIADRARYYEILRRAVRLALLGRATAITIFAVLAWKIWHRTRR